MPRNPRGTLPQRKRRESDDRHDGNESHPLTAGVMSDGCLQCFLFALSHMAGLYLRPLGNLPSESGDDLIVLFEQRRWRKRSVPMN